MDGFWAVREGCRPYARLGRRLRLFPFGSRVHDEGTIGDWPDLDGLLQEATKEEASELRPSPIESEGEFVQVSLKVVRLNSPLVGAE